MKIRMFFKKLKKATKYTWNKFLLFIGDRIGTGDDKEATWQKIRPASIYIVSALLALVILVSSFSFVLSKFFGSASKLDSRPILFTINRGASFSYVASELEERGIINSSFGIKLLADFTSVTSKIQSGDYILDKTMTPQEILDLITRPVEATKVVTVTLVEGNTIADFAKTLEANLVIESAEKFLEECKNLDKYSNFSFVAPLKEKTNLKYQLEGYLFPDTYEFYVDSSNETVINKLLTRFNTIFTEEYVKKAQELGLSVHEVVALASVIEKEGRGEDFSKISAVFHNRLKKGMKLESDVTVQYALGVKRLVLTADELKIDSPFNTYVVQGIPAGPICNPGQQAIRAALYPDEATLKGNYLYFTLTDPYTGEVAYSKTYDQHVATKNKYKHLWEEYDKKNQ